MGYFNVTVKPDILASKQHSAAFAAADVLFDWTAFDIPRGGGRLINATMIVRPKQTATPTKNNFGCFLLFASSNDVSLGTLNSAADNRPNNDLLGMCEFESTTSFVNQYPSSNLASTGRSSNTNNQHPSVVLAKTPDATTPNVGYDRYYVSCLANGAWDFQSIFQINDGDINSTTPTTIELDGTSIDAREVWLAGDVLHAHDDILLGTIDSITDADTIVLTSATSGAGDATTVADNDYVYNLNPIRIILSFEN